MSIEPCNMKWISVILLLSLFHISEFAKCTWWGVKEACTTGIRCWNGYECYRDLDDAPDKTKGYCCQMICMHSGLLIRHTNIDFLYAHKWSENLDPDLYYKDKNDSEVACPYPYSASTIYHELLLPNDFDQKTITPCETNGDCGEGSYCGYPVNPSFHQFSDEIRRIPIDRTNSGKPMSFCYRDPVFDKGFKVAFNPDHHGLPFCNWNSDCKNYNDTDSICYQFGKDQFRVFDKKNILKFWFNSGICAKAAFCPYLYDNTSHIGYLTKDEGYCKTDKDCEGVKDDYLYKGECRSSQTSNNGKVGMCCFATRKCRYGYARLPMKTCNVSSECNNATGKWDSWCDEEGYCCYDMASEYKPNILCPDGATLSMYEPECKQRCHSGICLHGHCCPERKFENGMAVRGRKPHATRTTCNPDDPLPSHYIYTYCSNDGFLVVLGMYDAFGNPFREKTWDFPCTRNSDCTSHQFEYCIRKDGNISSCSMDPFKPPKQEVEGKPMNYLLVVLLLCIFLVVVGFGVYFTSILYPS